MLLLWMAAAGWAQEPRFGTQANEVLIPASVMTKAGKPVVGLTAREFVVLSDGAPQAVRLLSTFDSVPLPIHAVIVLQSDVDSEPALAKIRKTASVISSYITNDMGIGTPSLAAVIAVGTDVGIAQDFTADPGVLRTTFTRFSSHGGGANRIIDGVSLACDLLAARKETARRLIVLISESRDLHSKAHFADVAVKAQKANITIYTISYSPYTTPFTQKASERLPPPDQPGLYDPASQGGINLLAIPMIFVQLSKINVSEAFAQATGGSHGKFTTLRGLETQLTAIGTEVHTRYTLTFVPPEKQAAGYHKLSVNLHNPGDWRIHARPGYWTGPE